MLASSRVRQIIASCSDQRVQRGGLLLATFQKMVSIRAEAHRVHPRRDTNWHSCFAFGLYSIAVGQHDRLGFWTLYKSLVTLQHITMQQTTPWVFSRVGKSSKSNVGGRLRQSGLDCLHDDIIIAVDNVESDHLKSIDSSAVITRSIEAIVSCNGIEPSLENG